jgi:hypothetical protein
MLGLLGTALAVGCTVKTTDDDDDDNGGAGAGADGGTSGTGGGKAGSGGSSGSGTGGSSGAGSGGKAGSGGSGGSTAGSGTSGSTSDAGEGGADFDTTPTCDPDSGDLANDPYPDCEATEGNDCEACIEQNCCEESMNCYSFNPGNVCGWGGPEDADGEREGEIVCYRDCMEAAIEANDGICETDLEDECIAMCTTETETESCGQIGNQTQELAGCMWTNCGEVCFGAESCE